MTAIHVGDRFKLAASTRTVYLAVRSYGCGEIRAVRVDSEYGKRALAWMDAGKPDNDERKALGRDFGWANPSTFYANVLTEVVVL